MTQIYRIWEANSIRPPNSIIQAQISHVLAPNLKAGNLLAPKIGEAKSGVAPLPALLPWVWGQIKVQLSGEPLDYK